MFTFYYYKSHYVLKMLNKVLKACASSGQADLAKACCLLLRDLPWLVVCFCWICPAAAHGSL